MEEKTLEPFEMKGADHKAAKAVFDDLQQRFAVTHKEHGYTGTAARIPSGSVGWARKTLGFPNIGVGDYILEIGPSGSNVFYISKTNLDALYELRPM